MTNGGFADAIVNGMLSWLKGFASWVLKLFDLAGSGGVSPLKWLSDHWLQTLIFLLVAGLVTDWVVWLIRWRPYWIWFRKKRVVVEDEDFFAGEKLADAGLYDALIFGREAIRRDVAGPPRPARPRTIVRRESPRPQTGAPRAVVPRAESPVSRAPHADGGKPSQRRPAHRRPAPRHESARVEAPDIFEDELFKIETAETPARKLREDEVFNVSNLPGAQRPKKRPAAAKKREENSDDDLFHLN